MLADAQAMHGAADLDDVADEFVTQDGARPLHLPVYWLEIRAGVVRDGVVVDFVGAVGAVRALKSRAEEALGFAVTAAATAFPPGVPAADSRACRYVLEQAGIECRDLSDEVSAAQRLLGIAGGAIADVGSGSTGIDAVKDGRLVSLADRPGGGHHLDLILAGALLAGTCSLAIISSNAIEVIRRILESAGIAHCFAHVFAGDVQPDKRVAMRQFLADQSYSIVRQCTPAYDEMEAACAPESHLGILSREFQMPCVMTAYLTNSPSRYVTGGNNDAHFAATVEALNGHTVQLQCHDREIGRVVEAA